MKIHRISPETLITLIHAHWPEKLTVPPKKSTGYSVVSCGMMTAGWPAYC